jgi:hypothetical protein
MNPMVVAIPTAVVQLVTSLFLTANSESMVIGGGDWGADDHQETSNTWKIQTGGSM